MSQVALYTSYSGNDFHFLRNTPFINEGLTDYHFLRPFFSSSAFAPVWCSLVPLVQVVTITQQQFLLQCSTLRITFVLSYILLGFAFDFVWIRNK